MKADCPLCNGHGGQVVFRHPLFRVIVADEPLYPGFLRLIWDAHVREFSDLSTEHRVICMEVVSALERFVLSRFKADKANLATLGNVVPHLHWHVIPRFTDDTHFPAPVWSAPTRAQVLCDRQVEIRDSQTVWVSELAYILGSVA